MAPIDLISVNYALISSQHGSFNRAAQLLGVRQSVVSRRVRALEDSLGVCLFERKGNRIYKTRAGLNFLKEAQSIVDKLETATLCARHAGKGLHGEIRIGLKVSLRDDFINNLILSFKADNPAVSLHFIDTFEDDFQRVFLNNDVNIIFRSLPTHAP